MTAFSQWLAQEYGHAPAWLRAHLAHAWNAAVAASADRLPSKRSEVLLLAGEMTAGELRTVMAVLAACRSRIGELPATPSTDDEKSACDGSADGNPLRTTPSLGASGATTGVRGAPKVADALVASPASPSTHANPVLDQIDSLLQKYESSGNPALDVLRQVRPLLVENDRLTNNMLRMLSLVPDAAASPRSGEVRGRSAPTPGAA